jgi:predicted RNA binding protein YcfA (HicA-like mRNA interferase family)
MSSKEVIKKLEAAGWSVDRQKGSHLTMKKDGEVLLLTIPHPRKTVSKGLLRRLERDSGVELL